MWLQHGSVFSIFSDIQSGYFELRVEKNQINRLLLLEVVVVVLLGVQAPQQIVFVSICKYL